VNNNDLMDALSGIDPKYIDEAAFELHVTPVQTAKVKAFRTRKAVITTLSAAAVVLLMMTVTLPFVMRLNKSQSASEAAYDSAAADSAASESEAVESEATGGAAYDAAEEAAPAYEAEEAAEAPAYDAAENAADSAEPAASQATAEKSEAASKTEDAAAPVIGLGKAEYKDGILTVDISAELPSDAGELEYAITGPDGSGKEKTAAEGRLADIMTEGKPLTLDISHLELQEGTYTLSIGDESTEFTV
jgi:hypothetical protein